MFPELQAIASRMGLAWITRLELIIGAMHEVAAEELARQFEACFEGTSFEDARVEIVIVQPDQTISAPDAAIPSPPPAGKSSFERWKADNETSTFPLRPLA